MGQLRSDAGVNGMVSAGTRKLALEMSGGRAVMKDAWLFTNCVQ